MDVYQIDEHGQLFISPDVDDWEPVAQHNIAVVFDLDESLDIGVPQVPNELIYVYFPFEDREQLPDLGKLHQLAQLGASLVRKGHRVLSHCGMGHNRSALLAGVILTYLEMTGAEAVALIQKKRTGALYNRTFAAYLKGLPSCALPSCGD